MTDWLWFKKNYGYFLLYNLFLLIVQSSVIILINSTPFVSIPYPGTIYFGLLAALGVQILLCLALSWLQTAMLWGIQPYCHSKQAVERWHVIIVIATLVAVISANCHFFPLSIFSRPFEPGIPSNVTGAMMLVSSCFLLLLTSLTLWRCARQKPGLLAAGLLCLIFFATLSGEGPSQALNQNEQPNLIIIGIDSLSPDMISPRMTPNLDRFLKGSVEFQDTISPLARTTPAWTSVLTGLYAIHHGARENLYPVQQIKHNASFAWNLKNRGYRTVFASDDRRFNSISTDYGFEEMVGPRMGIYDMILGTFYDFPLSNFLINLRMAKWLIPYNYTNRASFFSYYPSTFDHELQWALAGNANKKPLFLAVHFALAHWPYAWASSSTDQLTYTFNVKGKKALYNKAVHEADAQVGRLLAWLERQGALNNSMVIVLSDHGESLYTKGTRKIDAARYQGNKNQRFGDYLKRKTATELDKSGGHGSDLLSPVQFRCVLGFKIFNQGHLITRPLATSTPVALIDLAPTIADFFHFQLKGETDGISLLATITRHTNPVKNRMIMMESGMLPNQSMDFKDMIRFAKKLYHINPSNTHIEIKTSQFAYINAMKLYGVKYNEWLLALYPDDRKYIPVLLNLNSGNWSDDPDSGFIKSSPFPVLLSELRQFYKQDLSHYPRIDFSSSRNS